MAEKQNRNIDDRDVHIDARTQQQIHTLGNVDQDFDNVAATGDQSVAAGELWAQSIQTGDGNAAVGGSVYDSTLNTGDVAVAQ